MTAATSSLIAEGALKCVGTPFRHQGRRVRSGLDCIGVLVAAHKYAGLDVVDDIEYGKHPNPRILLKKVQMRADPVEGEPQEGDFFLSWVHAEMQGRPHHVGVFVPAKAPYQGMWMVHALEEAGKVVHCPYAGCWPEQTHSVWRWRR